MDSCADIAGLRTNDVATMQYYNSHPINCDTNDAYDLFLKNNCYRFSNTNTNGLITEDDILNLSQHEFITYDVDGPNNRLLDYWYCQIRCNDNNLKNLKYIMGYEIQFIDEILINTTNIVTNSILKHGFNAIHVRKGDFQFKEIHNLSISDIYLQLKYILDPTVPLYILTDQKDLSVFDYLNDKFNTILFWKDVAHLYTSVNIDYIPMIEMSLATKSNLFVGSRLSTFSGNIMIMRGFIKRRMDINSVNDNQVYQDLILYTNSPSGKEIIPYPTVLNRINNNQINKVTMDYVDVYHEQDKSVPNPSTKICTWDKVYRYFWSL